MILLWHYYWPVMAVGLLAGFLAGRRAFDSATGKFDTKNARRRCNLVLIGGAAAALLAASLWHGPLRAGDRFAATVESAARTTLGYYEMEAVDARLERSPLSRRLILAGQSDDIQQRELKRIMEQLPGVSDVQWANRPTAPVMMK